jgi:hypothetical protein
MSICIAAIANDCVDGDQVVVVTDHLITTGNFSSTEVVDPKVFTATTDGRWLGMGAGNLSAIRSIRRVYARAWVGKAQDLEDVVSGYQRAYKKELAKKIEDEILSRYGFTHERFFKEGHVTLGDKQFRRTMNQINDVVLDAELLLAGFDAENRPHVVSITTPGTRVIHDALGYHAIGSGAPLARACLTATYHGTGQINEVIYRVAEAKFRSEAEPHVGRKTTIMTLSSKGEMQSVTDADRIREVWAATANPPPPQRAMDLIPDLLTTIRETPNRARNSAGEDDSDEGIDEESGTGADEYNE